MTGWILMDVGTLGLMLSLLIATAGTTVIERWPRERLVQRHL